MSDENHVERKAKDRVEIMSPRKRRRLETQSHMSLDSDTNSAYLYAIKCSICFDRLTSENLAVLDCGHMFHTTCVISYFKFVCTPRCPLDRKIFNVNDLMVLSRIHNPEQSESSHSVGVSS